LNSKTKHKASVIGRVILFDLQTSRAGERRTKAIFNDWRLQVPFHRQNSVSVATGCRSDQSIYAECQSRCRRPLHLGSNSCSR